MVGFQGQITMVIPSENTVLVTMGRNGGSKFGEGSRGIARGLAYAAFPALGLTYDGQPLQPENEVETDWSQYTAEMGL
jgi:hypothetical protein